MLSLILLACVATSLTSVGAAAALVTRVPARHHALMVAFAAGVMLAAALLDLLPEALATTGSVESVLATVLAGLVLFHRFEQHAARHRDALSTGRHAGTGEADLIAASPALPWAVLLGDGLHNFVDGVLIAAAFLASPWLGLTTAIAIAMHELPQELGDFAVLLAGGWTRRAAFRANVAASLTSVAGGLVGWIALDHARDLLPYALALAAASLLYIAVAALMPWLSRRAVQDGTGNAVAMAVGVVFLPLAAHWLH